MRPELPSSQQLLKATKHLVHEYVGLQSSFSVCVRATRASVLHVSFNSFLVHYRNLVAFFRGTLEHRVQDDIYAIHYLPEWKCPNFPMADVWLPRGKKPKPLHKLLAHISEGRNAFGPENRGLDHRFDFGPMKDEISEAWTLFAQQLSETEYHLELQSQLRAKMAVLDVGSADVESPILLGSAFSDNRDFLPVSPRSRT